MKITIDTETKRIEVFGKTTKSVFGIAEGFSDIRFSRTFVDMRVNEDTLESPVPIGKILLSLDIKAVDISNELNDSPPTPPELRDTKHQSL